MPSLVSRAAIAVALSFTLCSLSAAHADSTGTSFTDTAAQSSTDGALTTDFLAALLGSGLIIDLFHTSSSSGSGTHFSSPSIAAPPVPIILPKQGGGDPVVIGPVSNGPTTPAPVPEASTSGAFGLLLILGLGSIAAARRRIAR